MNKTAMVQAAAVMAVTGVISVLFLAMIWQFLIALFLAAVFAGLSYPLYSWLKARFGGKENRAALGTLSILILIVLVPVLLLLNLIALQAAELTESLVPWIRAQIAAADQGSFEMPRWVPFQAQLEAVRPQIMQKLGELGANLGRFLVSGLSSATTGTAGFLLNLFVMLYAMFFFLKDGPALKDRLLRLTPIPPDAQLQLVDRGMSVTRATVKGTVIIGLVQGLLGGIAFAVVGIQGAAFWGAVMAVASFIPSIGTALVWVPAVGYLLVMGEGGFAFGLAVWCIVAVGGVDNLLRPVLVGGDTQMPDVLILISTLGGLAMFGVAGLIIGPVIAGLFITVWDLYELTFENILERGDKLAADTSRDNDERRIEDNHG